MTDVSLELSQNLARVYRPETHQKAVVDCQRMME